MWTFRITTKTHHKYIQDSYIITYNNFLGYKLINFEVSIYKIIYNLEKSLPDLQNEAINHNNDFVLYLSLPPNHNGNISNRGIR